MTKRSHLRAVNPNDSQPKADAGMSYRTIILVAVLTTVASQLVLDGYRAIKAKWQKRDENEEYDALPNPQQGMLPPAQIPMPSMAPPLGLMPNLPAATTAPWSMPVAANSPRPPTPEELLEWQERLQREQETLGRWRSNLEQQQSHWRLIQGA